GGILNIEGYSHASYTSYINGGLTNQGTINLNKYGVYNGRGRLNVEGGLFLSNGSSLFVSENNTLTVDGDFAMGLTNEADFDWGANSELVLTGGVGAGGSVGSIWDDWAYFEIGGSDFGDDPGTHQGDPNGFSDNFDLVELVIGEGARVYLGDYLDNGNRGGEYAYDEALYVDTLVLSSDSILNLNGLHLYYNELVGDISRIIDEEVPHSEQVPLPPAMLLFGSGLLGLAGLRKRFKN
ncbi:MAG: hypothetical protein SV487_10860, partial [Thermodesulfobacteriota bacterium]|nr:hypothetical protein [Thermodesulfobacteriota bacterium]